MSAGETIVCGIVAWLLVLSFLPLYLLRAQRRREARVVARGIADLENYANQQGATR